MDGRLNEQLNEQIIENSNKNDVMDKNPDKFQTANFMDEILEQLPNKF